MTVSTIIAIFRFLVWLVGVVQKAYDELPPEKQAEIKEDYEAWQKAMREMTPPMDGDGMGP